MAKADLKIFGKVPNARNSVAAVLSHGAFQHRVIKAKKGCGSYNRKEARKEARSSYEW